MSTTSAALTDSRIMLRRNLKHILRNPVTIFNAALMPVVLMLLLVYVFGNAFNVGEHYVEYATPGLILLAITYGLSLEPGDRRVKRSTIGQTDVLHGRTAPQCEGIAQQPYPPRFTVLATTGIAGLADEAFEPHGVDSVGFHPQPVAVRLPLDQAFRERLPQPGNQALQGIRRFGGRVLAPNPVDERCLRDHVTWLEREGDQQPAQSGARHVGEGAVVRANLK
jgi:hypothetical protein